MVVVLLELGGRGCGGEGIGRLEGEEVAVEALDEVVEGVGDAGFFGGDVVAPVGVTGWAVKPTLGVWFHRRRFLEATG